MWHFEKERCIKGIFLCPYLLHFYNIAVTSCHSHHVATKQKHLNLKTIIQMCPWQLLDATFPVLYCRAAVRQ